MLLYVIVLIFLGPLVGSLIGVMKKPSEGFMFNLLSFAAGVMIAISFLQLIPQSIALSSAQMAVLGIIIGSVVMFIVDKSIPHIHPGLGRQEQGKNLKRTAVYLIIGIFIHNFPEGIAIGAASVSGMSLSFIVAIAIAVHNIPEAICTSAPYFYSTKKRLKAFLLSMSTTIPTFVGFILAYYLVQYLSDNLVGVLVSATAGVMIYISADELIPTSCCKMTNHSTIFSLIGGVIFVVLLGLL